MQNLLDSLFLFCGNFFQKSLFEDIPKVEQTAKLVHEYIDYSTTLFIIPKKHQHSKICLTFAETYFTCFQFV